jgi:hypothetical protein
VEKSANKKWKESGTTLSFKEWINRENQKNEDSFSTESFIPLNEFRSLDSSWANSIKPNISSVQDTLQAEKKMINATAGFKQNETKGTVLGLDKGVLVFSTLIILGSIGFYIYKKNKTNG